MSARYRRFRPRRKGALTTGEALCVSTGILVPMVGPMIGIQNGWILGGAMLIGIAGAVEASVRAWREREPIPPPGRTLSLEGLKLRQTHEEKVTAEINLELPFEYRILDRRNVSEAIFRLYQPAGSLTFHYSDPGAKEIVRDVVGIQWPPRNRHAGRSYPPAAA